MEDAHAFPAAESSHGCSPSRAARGLRRQISECGLSGGVTGGPGKVDQVEIPRHFQAWLPFFGWCARARACPPFWGQFVYSAECWLIARPFCPTRSSRRRHVMIAEGSMCFKFATWCPSASRRGPRDSERNRRSRPKAERLCCKVGSQLQHPARLTKQAQLSVQCLLKM